MNCFLYTIWGIIICFGFDILKRQIAWIDFVNRMRVQ